MPTAPGAVRCELNDRRLSRSGAADDDMLETVTARKKLLNEKR
jgi:hypothetical protein